jgi:hypothetical protein
MVYNTETQHSRSFLSNKGVDTVNRFISLLNLKACAEE